MCSKLPTRETHSITLDQTAPDAWRGRSEGKTRGPKNRYKLRDKNTLLEGVLLLLHAVVLVARQADARFAKTESRKAS